MQQKKFDIDGRHAVITGGASGIGFALARALGSRGCKVMLAEPGEERLRAAAESLRASGINASYQVCDVTDLTQVEHLADVAWNTLGQVDLVFNNAGIAIPQTPVIETSMDDLHAIFNVNFFGIWHGCRVFAPRLIEQGTPAGIYNTGSENSLFNAVPNNAAYLASKHAVLGMTDNLREQMPGFVNVGLIIPGFVRSGMTKAVGHLAMDADKFASIVLEQVSAGEFYIVSHACNMEPIKQRYEEIAHAYERYAPRYSGDEEFDVRHLLSKLGG